MHDVAWYRTMNYVRSRDAQKQLARTSLKHRILFRVLSMFSLKWRNVLFAKDDGKGNFLAVTCRKGESIQVSRRKEALFTERLVQVSNCILGVWNLLTQPKRLHKLVKRFLAITSSFIIHSLKTRLAASLGLCIALLTCLLLSCLVG